MRHKGQQVRSACGHETRLPLERVIQVGRGFAGVVVDGDVIYSEGSAERVRSLAYFEGMARKDPLRDWKVYLYTAEAAREYQRQGDGEWVLVFEMIHK